jgi:hypothetical protein
LFSSVSKNKPRGRPALGGEIADQRGGAKDRGEYRQAAGAFAERLNVMREQMKGSDRRFSARPLRINPQGSAVQK